MSLRHAPPEEKGSWASDEATRRVMLGNRARDTSPERALRSAVHALGLRYRVDLPMRVGGLRTRPDLVFSRARVVVFVDGCFWHHCPEHGVLPKANREFWRAKFERNVARDRRIDRALGDAGWTVVRVWEHESTAQAVAAVRGALRR